MGTKRATKKWLCAMEGKHHDKLPKYSRKGLSPVRVMAQAEADAQFDACVEPEEGVDRAIQRHLKR